MMDGVGISDRAPEAETGNVKPGPLSNETARKSGFLMEIDGNGGLIALSLGNSSPLGVPAIFASFPSLG